MHRGRQSSGGAAPAPPDMGGTFPETTTSRRPPEVGCDIRRLSCPHRFLQDSHDPSGFEW